MNYYKRHLGDYAKDTRHLSATEHGVYTLLLDYLYATEKPIPNDRCDRIANAYADFERDAVRSVLSQFFTETPDGWVNRRALAEIEASQAKSLKAKESAEERWKRTQCDRSANASETHSERNASHKPLANSHKKEQGASPSGSRLPADWQPTEDELRWARDARPDLDVQAEVERFRDYWHGVAGAKGRKASWPATWRNWVRGARLTRGGSEPAPTPRQRRQL